MMSHNDLAKHLKLDSLLQDEHVVLKKLGLPVINLGGCYYTFEYLTKFWQKFKLNTVSTSFKRDWEIVALVYKNEDTRRVLITLLGLLTHQEFIADGAFVIFEKLGIEGELQEHPDLF